MSLWLFDVEVEAAASERVLFWIDLPSPGTTVYGDELEVTGWAFAPEDPAVEVEVEAEVRGHAGTRVRAAQPRPDVARAYPQFSQAGLSGFALLASVPRAPLAEVGVSMLLGDERVEAATIRLAGRPHERWSAADAPLVSVIVPCYNQARFLGEAVASVRAQTYPRVELIVVDDGSTDDTAAVAASLGARCIRQENGGLAAARNRGAAAAAGEYLVFLDADDRLLPHGIEANMDAIAERPDAALTCGWFRYLMAGDEPPPYPVKLFETERNEVVGLMPPPALPERDHYKALLENAYNILMGASVLYRSEVFRAAGGFDGSYPGHEDYDLYFRLLREHPMVAHSIPIAEYRRRPASMARNSALMLDSALATMRAQRTWVRHDDALRAAHERGLAPRRRFYGEQLAQDLQRAVRTRDWRAAGRAAWVLARRYPRGLAYAIGAPQPPHPVRHLRDYLHIVRVSAEQTRDEVRASRVELAEHLTRLEAIAAAQVEQLEKLVASRPHDWVQALNLRVRDQTRALALLEERLGVPAAPRRSEQSSSSPAEPGDVLAGTDVTLRADSRAGPPRLTVIMSTYNQERFVGSAVESVFAQRTDFPIQLIVTDDASTDSTLEIVETFRARRPDLVTVIRSEKNGWYFANVLRALALTKTDYFTLLDADDYWTDETYLQRGVDFLDGHPEFVIYSASVVCVHPDGSRVPYFPERAPDAEFSFEDYLQNRAAPSQTTATMFRNVFFKSGVPKVFADMVGTDDQYAFAGDWDRYIVYLEQGKARFENRAVGVYRMGVGWWTGLNDLEQALWAVRSRLSHWRYFGHRHPEFFLSRAVAESDRCLEIMRDARSEDGAEIVVKPEHVADLRRMVEECRLQLAALT